MTRLTLTQVIAGLCEFARPIMLEKVRPDSCIAMTRVGVEVLNHFGYVAAPLNVEALVVNAEYHRRLEAGLIAPDRLPTDADFAAGAWGIGIGLEEHMRELATQGVNPAGHVVAVVGAFLVDLSLDQASRPEKGINLEPHCFEFDADVYAGATWTYRINGGEAFVEYKLRPDLESWRDSPDWRLGLKRYRSEIGRIIRAVREGCYVE
jgi:hypothetical protein